MNLLMALGQADPDPPFSVSNDHSSPILAAIGGENIKVVKLLVDQSMDRFDPTRRFKGETYYEIARKRRGPNWIEEEQILKDAYDSYMKNYKQLPKDLKERQKMRKEARGDGAARSSKRAKGGPGQASQEKRFQPNKGCEARQFGQSLIESQGKAAVKFVHGPPRRPSIAQTWARAAEEGRSPAHHRNF